MNKQKWGNACWYLFHTMAYKLKKEYEHYVPELLTHIMSICNNLPCPDCSNHAMREFQKLNRQKVKTKDDLITVLWEFHNKVNKRLKKSEFTIVDHNKKYEKANIQNIYKNFLNIMFKRVGSERAMIYNMSRRNALIKFDKFILSHTHIFDIN